MSPAPPFGALSPTRAQERARRLAAALPRGWAGRKAASLLLGPAGGRLHRAYDVEIFGSQRARLHPFDNICEKRVYLVPHHWDADEREMLASAVCSPSDKPFYFLDIGANAGLYTLFARSAAAAAGRRFKAACIEPDPVMQGRLAFNVAASGAADDVTILPYAAAARDGEARFAVESGSRGLSRLQETGGLTVQTRSIVSLLVEWAPPHVDALKIDIEGHEHSALEAFFRNAPPVLLPNMIILETAHETPERSASALVLGAGYATVLWTKKNLVAKRVAPPTDVPC